MIQDDLSKGLSIGILNTFWFSKEETKRLKNKLTPSCMICVFSYT